MTKEKIIKKIIHPEVPPEDDEVLVFRPKGSEESQIEGGLIRPSHTASNTPKDGTIFP